MINPRLGALPPYPFRRLAALLDGVNPGAPPIDLSIGEPRHAPPPQIARFLSDPSARWNAYPPVAGTPAWKEAVADWLARRYALPHRMIPPQAVIPASGTREALFMLGQVLIDATATGAPPLVLMPDPSYLPYLGATLMNGAVPVAVPARAETNFQPDFGSLPEAVLARASVLIACSPANPQGTLIDADGWRRLVRLARAHDIVLVADECYSEIYDRAPPPGVLEACRDLGGSLDGVLVCNSLSKRSSAAGLRSGFVAGDPALVEAFSRLRAYGAAGMPVPIQEASAALWADDSHVAENRALYQAKIDAAQARLGTRMGFYRPPGGFFLWLDTTGWEEDGETAAVRLWRDHGLKVLPGATMSADPAQADPPGRHRLRLALVHNQATIEQALDRLIAAAPG
ncbi:aminotransferase class I/II-fold pyridoxal phosphate-dependent enzyme [Pararhodospirillum oryzae]|uniref:Aminotransferase n=1 Tax=Pararhodospirillum oryzae TaxID=478448 RepID=A0A512HB01_9PROT|nr:aminotransferase class I/II-fold pyridoxal phosphate-dependent enzyme [Pararhodospirillum oryzae]GEO82641.1 aminotransferase [Pararhodospirillum oryzae]